MARAFTRFRYGAGYKRGRAADRKHHETEAPLHFTPTPDRLQMRRACPHPVREGLGDKVHSILRAAVSIMPSGHIADGSSETASITGDVWPPEIRLYRSAAARAVL